MPFRTAAFTVRKTRDCHVYPARGSLFLILTPNRCQTVVPALCSLLNCCHTLFVLFHVPCSGVSARRYVSLYRRFCSRVFRPERVAGFAPQRSGCGVAVIDRILADFPRQSLSCRGACAAFTLLAVNVAVHIRFSRRTLYVVPVVCRR